MTFRYLQVGYQVLTDKVDRLIDSHEVEDAIEQAINVKKGA